MAFAVLLISGIMAITVVGLPIAKSLLQFAKLSAFPYGKKVVRETQIKGKDGVSSVRKIGGIIANIIWFPFGIFLSLGYIVLGIFAFITIIGIPIGVVLVRMGLFVLFPIGAKVVTKGQASYYSAVNEIEKRSKEKSK